MLVYARKKYLRLGKGELLVSTSLLPLISDSFEGLAMQFRVSRELSNYHPISKPFTQIDHYFSHVTLISAAYNLSRTMGQMR
jgi:hypothetical protein